MLHMMLIFIYFKGLFNWKLNVQVGGVSAVDTFEIFLIRLPISKLWSKEIVILRLQSVSIMLHIRSR